MINYHGQTVELEDSGELADLLDILSRIEYEPDPQMNGGRVGSSALYITLMDENRELTHLTYPTFINGFYGYRAVSGGDELQRHFLYPAEYEKYDINRGNEDAPEEAPAFDLSALSADNVISIELEHIGHGSICNFTDHKPEERAEMIELIKKIQFTPEDGATDEDRWDECEIAVTIAMKRESDVLLTLPLSLHAGHYYRCDAESMAAFEGYFGE
jgi:hypothetical protein